MPSFDVVSEVNKMEIKNAVDAAVKELATRFDFKGADAGIELEAKTDLIKLRVADSAKIKALREIMMGKLAKRNIDLRNVETKDAAISPLGHATQELQLKQGIDGDKAKEITRAIKASFPKVQSTLQDRQVRVTGKSRDELQAVIAFLRSKDFEIGLGFGNFRD